MAAVTSHRLPGGVPVAALQNASVKFGRMVRRTMSAAGVEYS
jgi:hypothetical protein